jgi:membrane-anchored glycerophosphoryl diester phosphodiesterase (GDPDase)
MSQRWLDEDRLLLLKGIEHYGIPDWIQIIQHFLPQRVLMIFILILLLFIYFFFFLLFARV